MRRVFVESVEADAQDLGRDEARHVRDVLRLGPGDPIVLFDGRGAERSARLESVGRRAVRVRAQGPAVSAAPDPGPEVVLLLAVLKGEAMDRVVRSATELGVAAIRPVYCERSVPAPRPGRSPAERWRRIAREAARQSGRPRVPDVLAPAPLEASLAVLPPLVPASRRVVCWEGERHRALAEVDADSVVLAVGPEGGFTDAEVRGFLAAGFEPRALSDAVLRADTAALAALAVARRRARRG